MEEIDIIKIMWPIFTLIFFVGVVKILESEIPEIIKILKQKKKFKGGEKWRNKRDKLTWLRELTPKEFEDYIANLFLRLGYKTTSVGGPNDGGIDVIAEKSGRKHYIQCKKYFKAREVSVGDIRDFYGAIADRLANGKAYFITTNRFTLSAEEFVKDKPIELVDSYRLLEYIKLAKPGKEEKEPKTENCPRCGGVLKRRSGKYGDFMGCSNYPKCKYTQKI